MLATSTGVGLAFSKAGNGTNRWYPHRSYIQSEKLGAFQVIDVESEGMDVGSDKTEVGVGPRLKLIVDGGARLTLGGVGDRPDDCDMTLGGVLWLERVLGLERRRWDQSISTLINLNFDMSAIESLLT